MARNRSDKDSKMASDVVSKTQGGDSYEALQAAGQQSSGLLGRVGGRFQDALQTSRGGNRTPSARDEGGNNPNVSADDLALRRARNVSTQRMIIPEGVIIDGSLNSGSETDINGRIDGNVTVEGYLNLGPAALVSGNVRAQRCTVEGCVDGKMECSDEIILGRNGRLNADCIAGKQISVAGQIFGDIQCSGLLRIEASAQVTGNIMARKIIMEEGAMLNGTCAMRPAAERVKEAK